MAPAAWRPLVSVVIPAYNAEAVIGDALRSVFAQTFRDFEVVVVDDGSTDDTVGVLEAIGGGVRLLRQPNGGPAAARNAGIAVTTAPLIAFLDADDEWLPAKLEMQMAYFAAYPEAGVAPHGHRPRRGSEDFIRGVDGSPSRRRPSSAISSTPTTTSTP